MEVISGIVKKHKDNIDELLETKEALDPRTAETWIKKEKIPKKSNLDKLRKTVDYSVALKEFVKEKEEDYEKQRYYYQKIELNEFSAELKKLIDIVYVKVEFENEE